MALLQQGLFYLCRLILFSCQLQETSNVLKLPALLLKLLQVVGFQFSARTLRLRMPTPNNVFNSLWLPTQYASERGISVCEFAISTRKK